MLTFVPPSSCEMKNPTKAEVLAAATELVNTEDVTTVNRWLNLLEPVVDEGIDLTLEGAAAFLQPLLELRRKDISAYVNVMQKIDEARKDDGLSAVSERKGKTAYLAEFMRTKRQRETRIVKIWNEMLSARDQLKGDARKAFMLMHARRWHAERERRTDALRKQLGRALTLAETRAVVNKLLDDIDLELQELEEFVRQELRTPIQQRNPNGFTWKVGKL